MRRITEAKLRIGAASVAALFIGSAFLAFSSATPAVADYPPPTTAATSCSSTQSINVGGSATVTLTCAFAPNSVVTLTFNGAAFCTVTVPASGILTEVFTVTDGPHITVSGCPTVAATFGATNTFVATGTNPGGGQNVATTLVTVPAPAAAATASTGPVAFTGADLAATVVGGAALLAMGFALVFFARRRSGRATDFA
jgi:hypothetical protein